MATLPDLKLITLTIANGHDLAERIATLRTARRRFLDLRIGRNNRARIRRAVETTITQALNASRIDQAKADRWHEQAERWLSAVAKTKTRDGKSPKVRKLLSGLASLEITHDAQHGWHAHLHCIVSMRYMPQIVLSVLWRMATRGAGRIVDIRKIDDVGAGIAETMKYATKPGNIPDELGPTVLAALRGVRRLTRIGNIKPVEPEPLPCPGCGTIGCPCFHTGTLNANDIALNLDNVENGQYVKHIYDHSMGVSYDARVKLYHDDRGHQCWKATPIAGSEMVLSTQRSSVSREGGTSPPTGPPMSDDDAPRELQAIEASI